MNVCGDYYYVLEEYKRVPMMEKGSGPHPVLCVHIIMYVCRVSQD